MDAMDETISDAEASGLRVAALVSRYNRAITDRLLEGATHEFERRGGRAEDLEIVPAPGAFELAALAGATIDAVDAIVALGCIIQGETSHDRVLAHALAGALADLSARTGKPVAFGVLTAHDFEQAQRRARPVAEVGVPDQLVKGKVEVSNKGVEAMAAAIDAVHAARRFRERVRAQAPS